jgi:hypothetical protein
MRAYVVQDDDVAGTQPWAEYIDDELQEFLSVHCTIEEAVA